MSVKNATAATRALPATSEAPKISIEALPDETLLHVVLQGNFSASERARLQSVNKRFKEVCSSNELWRDLVVPRLCGPMPSTQGDKEPPLFEDILGMGRGDLYALGAIWRMPTPARHDAWPFDLMRSPSNSRQIAYALLQKQGLALCLATQEHRQDKPLVLAAITQNGAALQHAAPELRADKEVVLAAVRQDGAALRWAAPQLQADKEVVLVAVRQKGAALKWAAPELKADEEVVLAAVAQNGQALQHAASSFKADKEVVLAAIKQNWRAFDSAASALKNDPEVVRAMQKAQREDFEKALHDGRAVIIEFEPQAPPRDIMASIRSLWGRI